MLCNSELQLYIHNINQPSKTFFMLFEKFKNLPKAQILSKTEMKKVTGGYSCVSGWHVPCDPIYAPCCTTGGAPCDGPGIVSPLRCDPNTLTCECYPTP